jgi:monoamine oxidase
MKITRRSLVVGGVAAAAGAALATKRAFAADAEYDAIIIGAGLAGLNAAITLREAGLSVLVLEGGARAGGRVMTAYDMDDRIELGGVQIGPTYARVRDMAGRLGVELAPGAHINAPYSFVLDGKLIPAKQWADSPLNPLQGAERTIAPHVLGSHFIEARNPFTALDDWLKPESKRYDLSWLEWLTQQGASETARKLISVGQGNTDLATLSVLRSLQESTYAKLNAQLAKAGASDKDSFQRSGLTSSHVVGGSTLLTKAMAASVGDRLRLQHKVVSIDLQKGGGEVACANGKRFRGKRVIAAVPFTLLRDIRITPSLVGEQADAVARMTYGDTNQVWLRVKAPYWDDDGIDASMWSDGPFTLIRQQLEYDGKRELMSCLSFGMNAKKIDQMSPADRGRAAIRYIEQVRPATKGKLEFIGAQSWGLSPLERGCSYGLQPGHAWAWANAMITPHRGLHFAGEHTRRLEIGMEAAMESGERAALEVAVALG